jgi:hypothetical protein
MTPEEQSLWTRGDADRPAAEHVADLPDDTDDQFVDDGDYADDSGFDDDSYDP